MSGWQGIFWAVVTVAGLLPGPAPLSPEEPLEYEVKAAFLYNFTRFVEWPPEAFPEPAAPLTVCIAGADPFGAALDEMFADETYQGRPYSVRRVARTGDLTRCHLLFVPRTVRPRAILSRPLGEATLTVGESPDFIEAGGILNFYLEQNRVRFEIHQAAAERSTVRIGSQLMRLARLIPGDSALLYSHALFP